MKWWLPFCLSESDAVAQRCWQDSMKRRAKDGILVPKWRQKCTTGCARRRSSNFCAGAYTAWCRASRHHAGQPQYTVSNVACYEKWILRHLTKSNTIDLRGPGIRDDRGHYRRLLIPSWIQCHTSKYIHDQDDINATKIRSLRATSLIDHTRVLSDGIGRSTAPLKKFPSSRRYGAANIKIKYRKTGEIVIIYSITSRLHLLEYNILVDDIYATRAMMTVPRSRDIVISLFLAFSVSPPPLWCFSSPHTRDTRRARFLGVPSPGNTPRATHSLEDSAPGKWEISASFLMLVLSFTLVRYHFFCDFIYRERAFTRQHDAINDESFLLPIAPPAFSLHALASFYKQILLPFSEMMPAF